ncbi:MULTISPECIES: hypothetical protein [Nostocales]|uniref:hypothetical protein n=1 Tax=Nostocales TaxID=1161 RepID=UPI00130DE1A4|nr:MULTISPECIES: hypothetical protein [Nostocales]MBO1053275.1 hypothetical protein [Dolichospermum sp. DET73]
MNLQSFCTALGLTALTLSVQLESQIIKVQEVKRILMCVIICKMHPLLMWKNRR